MYCPKCGIKIDENYNFCYKCGVNIKEIQNINKQEPEKKAIINQDNNDIKIAKKIYTKSGIGGWLLLYIILLSFNCIITLINLTDLSETINRINELKSIFYSSSLISAIIVIWAIISIYLLCIKSKMAINNIKTFIICQPMILICDYFIQYIIVRNKFNEELASKFIKELDIAHNLVGILLFSCIWFFYFTYSKRVKNTYGS